MNSTTLDWLIVNQGQIVLVLLFFVFFLILFVGVRVTAKVVMLSVTVPAYCIVKTVNATRRVLGIAGNQSASTQSAWDLFRSINLLPEMTYPMAGRKRIWPVLAMAAGLVLLLVTGLSAGWTRYLRPISPSVLLELPKLHCPDKPNANTLLIFIHGWNGETAETWRQFPNLVCDDKKLKNVNVMSFDYPTYMLKRNLRLAELADFLNKQGKAAGLFDQYKRTIILSHSMGGLVARELALLQDSSRASHKPKLIIEIGTPHLGASLAELGKMLGVDKEQAEEAAPESSFLKSLGTHWNNMRDRPKTSCFTSPQDRVVTQASATYQCDDFTAYAGGDHREIAKPPSRTDARYALPIAVVHELELASDLPALFSTLEKTDAVVEGSISPKRILYVFFDANCWYCHLTWKALQPYEKAGLQVRWVPVAYQKESSTTKAAAIMLAKDRGAAFRENEMRYRAKSYDGGIAPAKNPPKAIVAQLEANFELMDRFGLDGTPGLVWKDAAGKVHMNLGMPRLSKLPAITGLPAQKINDPELAELR